jgi:hypothetical protein
MIGYDAVADTSMDLMDAGDLILPREVTPHGSRRLVWPGHC